MTVSLCGARKRSLCHRPGEVGQDVPSDDGRTRPRKVGGAGRRSGRPLVRRSQRVPEVLGGSKSTRGAALAEGRVRVVWLQLAAAQLPGRSVALS